MAFPFHEFIAEIIDAARQSMMVRRDGNVAVGRRCGVCRPADTPICDERPLHPRGTTPQRHTDFTPLKNHKTWGRRVQPLGSWRITNSTRTLVVLEGLFDMLITAQKLHQLGREADTVAVYTNGVQSKRKNASVVL